MNSYVVVTLSWCRIGGLKSKPKLNGLVVTIEEAATEVEQQSLNESGRVKVSIDGKRFFLPLIQHPNRIVIAFWECIALRLPSTPP